ncbi:MAG: methyltransferase domain-containing protein [Planctomycetes bacterium]|nr:methyltransferase domain-containing protein [Planctomycetota bacterium]
MTGDGEPTRASEALLFSLLDGVKSDARIWSTSPGRGQLAAAAAAMAPERKVTCTFLDLFMAEAARDAAVARDGTVPANLVIDCAADLPSGPFDVAMIPLRAGADSELAWELLQHAYVQLADGGRLYASVDEPRDHWVAGRMEALFGARFSRHTADDAIAYSGIKRTPLKKVKEFGCEFAFRDRDRLIPVVSRPGVFSHRRLDLGARALIESLEETGENGLVRDFVDSGGRVIDYGCGAGAVGLAAAFRAHNVVVHAVDSMPRAADCARRGAEKNGLTTFTTQACADGEVEGAGTFDLFLGNPPYYSHHKISELFVRAAVRTLKQAGRAQFVTKQPEWFMERMPKHFHRVVTRELRTYAVVVGVKR